MRILIDMDSEQVKRLDSVAQSRKASRAAIIREAVEAHLHHLGAAEVDGAFGLWRGRAIDGLAYQEKIRSEW